MDESKIGPDVVRTKNAASTMTIIANGPNLAATSFHRSRYLPKTMKRKPPLRNVGPCLVTVCGPALSADYLLIAIAPFSISDITTPMLLRSYVVHSLWALAHKVHPYRRHCSGRVCMKYTTL